MPRKPRSQQTQRTTNSGFQFIWVQWTDPQLDALRKFLSNHPDSAGMQFQELADASWKVSVSTNQRSGKYLVALTDKGGRSGCSSKTFAVEHRELISAVAASYYFAMEILGDTGYSEEEQVAPDLF